MRSAEPPALLGTDSGPWNSVRHGLVLAPQPDDFDGVAITLRHFKLAGARISPSDALRRRKRSGRRVYHPMRGKNGRPRD
jgi:hypothetical protein